MARLLFYSLVVLRSAGDIAHRLKSVPLKIQSALVVQQFQIPENVLRYFFWRGFGINFLQLADDLLHGVLTVATLDDFEAGALQTECAFGH